MRLIGLHVDDFGCLHDYDYTFEDGLNVVLHDNGWGKTTMGVFLKAMLYGFGSKRSKDITENERRRYLPWQGGKYGGFLDFEAGGVRYRIVRTFGETPRFDRTRILNLDTNTTAKLDPEKIGESLFGLDVSAFQRSVFINQNGLSLDGAASSIHTRLNALVSQANDVAAFDDAIGKLTAQIKLFERTGARGQIGDITRQIAALEKRRDQLESDIAAQDGARARLQEVGVLLDTMERDLGEKRKRLDELTGERQKREASRELLEDLDRQIGELQEKMDAIRTGLGGEIPSAGEIEQVKGQRQSAAALAQQLTELERRYAGLEEEYSGLLEHYRGVLPTAAQLDEIQSIYGELQGVRGLEGTEPEGEEPEGYTRIMGASSEKEDYLPNLQRAVDAQEAVQQQLQALERAEQDWRRGQDTWASQKKRYTALAGEAARLGEEAGKQSGFAPEKVAPAVAALEELQKTQQLVDVRAEELSGERLTEEQEALLAECPGELPDAAEGNAVRERLRGIAQKTADMRGLEARKAGEQSRVDSLQVSIGQLDALPEQSAQAVEEPKKSLGAAMIGAGAAVTVLGAVLTLVLAPVLAAVAAAGVVLAALGVVDRRRYRARRSAYEAYQASSAQREEGLRKRAELQAQLDGAKESVAGLQGQIDSLFQDIQADQALVDTWAARWLDGGEASEASVSAAIDRGERVAKLRRKKQETAEKERFVAEKTAYIAGERERIDGLFPELAGASYDSALKLLRAREGDYKVLDGQRQAALRSLEDFLAETQRPEAQFAGEEAPELAELADAKEAAARELARMEGEAREVLAPLGLEPDPGQLVQALREAGRLLQEYRQYAEQLRGRAQRQEKKQAQIRALEGRLEEKLTVLQGRYPDAELPERLALVREEIGGAANCKERAEEAKEELERQRAELEAADRATAGFAAAYGRFEPETEDIFAEIYGKASAYAELSAARQQLDRQRTGVELEETPAGAEETDLRRELARLEEQRDALRDEYAHKSDFIRRADQSLEQYPDVVQEIQQLYDQKQKAQNTLAMLKHTVQLITRAKENLANRYLSKVEQLFNSYMQIWLDQDAVRGVLDIDFNITIEENDAAHVAEGYSTGCCDLIDFCMRLALVDTLFEGEQPFLILDDPFVNLDVSRLDRALELLHMMAANKQIIYFVCHPIRAVEAGGDAETRARFVQLAEMTQRAIEERRAAGTAGKGFVRKSPKEMYRVVSPNGAAGIRPALAEYTITNHIFSMNFVRNEAGAPGDSAYELFFIDAVGHVLNDRQLVEVKNGKLSTQRVQFCLNTREDSGDQYELMIRESGQDDYEVAARIPFPVKLAFAGTFGFDF